MDTDSHPDTISKPPPKDSASESPSRVHYNEWYKRMEGIKQRHPGVILDITPPDDLNEGLTLEDIDRQWEQLSENLDEQTRQLYEVFKAYLTCPRFKDSFDDTIPHRRKRREFKKKLEKENREDHKAFEENDLRANRITSILYVILGDMIPLPEDKNLKEKYEAIFKRMKENAEDENKALPIEEKIGIADDIRKLARSVIFPESQQANSNAV